MPTANRSRTIAVPLEELWEMICDPHHLPRWWPRVTRVEDVTLTSTGEAGAFTEVMKTRKGKLVRADFELVASDRDARRIVWAQRVEGTPFARLLKSAETEVRLQPEAVSGLSESGASGSTQVTLELRQALNGVFPRFGGYMVSRAARATLEEALDGLERIGG